jgi:hypothetical protein
MRATGRLLVAGLCCVSFTSCVWHPRYPRAWAPREPGTEGVCPDVAGTYENLGESSGKSPKPRWLSSILFGLYTATPSFTGTVELRQPDDDTLEVLVWNGPEAEHRVFSRGTGDLSWDADRLKVRHGYRRLAAEGLGLVGGWQTVYLARDTDGWLVVKLRVESIGLLLIIPMFGSMSGWSRFAPAGGASG